MCRQPPRVISAPTSRMSVGPMPPYLQAAAPAPKDDGLRALDAADERACVKAWSLLVAPSPGAPARSNEAHTDAAVAADAQQAAEDSAQDDATKPEVGGSGTDNEQPPQAAAQGPSLASLLGCDRNSDEVSRLVALHGLPPVSSQAFCAQLGQSGACPRQAAQRWVVLFVLACPVSHRSTASQCGWSGAEPQQTRLRTRRRTTVVWGRLKSTTPT